MSLYPPPNHHRVIAEVPLKILIDQEPQQNINIARAFKNTTMRGASENVNMDTFWCTSFRIFSVALGILIFSDALPLQLLY